MSNPIDEFLEYEKTAGVGSFLKGIGRGLTSMSKPVYAAGEGVSPEIRAAYAAMQRGANLGQQMQSGAALAAGGAAITGIGLAAKKIIGAIDKRRDFRQMMELDPELGDLQKRDTKFFNAAYSSMRNVNPTFGRDPITSGAMMHNMLANPEIAGAVLMGSVKTPEAPKPSGLGLDVSVPMGPATFSRKF